MTKNNKPNKKGIIAFGFLCVCTFTTVVYSSCTKKSDSNDAAKFVGTFTGTSSCGGAASVTFAAGSNGSSLKQTGDVGSASCFKTVTINFNVSGNSLTMPAQTFSDNCGATYTTSGSGTLSGNTLTFTQSISSSLITATCVFTGTK